MTNRKYVIRHGDAWIETTEHGRPPRAALDHVASASQLLAIAYDVEGGDLVKHGEHGHVSAWLLSPKGTVAQALYGAIEIVAFPVHPATVAALNACLDCPGRAGHLVETLGAIAAAHPALALPRWLTSPAPAPGAIDALPAPMDAARPS